MSALGVIGVLMLALPVTILGYDLLLGRSRRQRAVRGQRLEVVDDALAPNRPDFDAPFRRP